MPKYKFTTKIWLWLKAAKKSAVRLYQDDYGYDASALAFITILSFVPVLTVIIYFFTFFPSFNQIIFLAKNYAYTNFLPSSNEALQGYVYSFINQATKLPLLSILFLVGTSVIMIATIKTTFNHIWHVENKHVNITSIGFLACLILFFPLFVGFASIGIQFLDNLLWLKPAQVAFLTFGNLVINSIVFILFYVLVPNHRVSWHNGIYVGILTACFFELIKKGFVIYINHFASYELIYGALAVIPIILLWVYICWYMVLYGAILLQTKDNETIHLNEK